MFSSDDQVSRDHSLTIATRSTDKTRNFSAYKDTLSSKKHIRGAFYRYASTVRSWHAQLNHRHLTNSPSSLSSSRCTRAVSSPTKSSDKSPTRASLRLVVFASWVQSTCGRYSCRFPVCRGRMFSVLLYLLQQQYRWPQRLVYNYSTSKFIQSCSSASRCSCWWGHFKLKLCLKDSRDSWAQLEGSVIWRLIWISGNGPPTDRVAVATAQFMCCTGITRLLSWTRVAGLTCRLQHVLCCLVG